MGRLRGEVKIPLNPPFIKGDFGRSALSKRGALQRGDFERSLLTKGGL